ncbi:MAG TPA: RNase adapter RapZ [Salinivirgaceae bacterium]|nr:RNase adapter RapZ [Salinivirgaceae bacterium]
MRLETFYELLNSRFGVTPDFVEKLPNSASSRQYVRLHFHNKTIIGAYNPNPAENDAFFYLANLLAKHSIRVPEVVAVDSSGCYYLCSDLGNQTLYHLTQKDISGNLLPESMALWKVTIRQLLKIQTIPKLEPEIFSHCLCPQQFNRQAVVWDLNYFKYNFLKLLDIEFDECRLESDFEQLASIVEQIPLQGFMYRDFQSRNVMIFENTPYFIDFQGGRRGPMQYDVISFLYQTRVGLSDHDIYLLLQTYLDEFQKMFPDQREFFWVDFQHVRLVRLLQVLGAYGFRGIFQRKQNFVKTIPQTIAQLNKLFSEDAKLNQYPEIKKIAVRLSDWASNIFQQAHSSELTIFVSSFSFLNGSYPMDWSGHGGGYIFDCRGLPNPGRESKYQNLTGKDIEVIEYFKAIPEVSQFIDKTIDLVLSHILEYKNRGFTTLSVSFGCSGGQHRSVYCAQAFANAMTLKGYKVVLKHREFPEL